MGRSNTEPENSSFQPREHSFLLREGAAEGLGKAEELGVQSKSTAGYGEDGPEIREVTFEDGHDKHELAVWQ